MPVWKCHRITTASVINLLLDEVMTKPETISWFWPQSVFHSRTPFNPAQVRCSDHWLLHHLIISTSLVAQWLKNPPANAGDVGLIPGLGRNPGGGNDNPLQYSCLKHPMGGGVWQTTVHEITELDMTEQLNACARAHARTHTHTHTSKYHTAFWGGKKHST